MDRMADSVTSWAKPNAETLTGAAEEQVIVGVLEILLNQIVIHVLNRNLGTDPIQIHGF